MKLNEILVIREDGLKIFKVDDSTLAKLIRIRGNLFKDDPKLRTVSELPTMTPEPQQAETVYSPAAIEATARAVALYKMMRDAKPVTALPIVKEEPKPMSFEEQIKHDWRFNPGIRKEFAGQASYEAYCRAIRAGRCKAYGQGTPTR